MIDCREAVRRMWAYLDHELDAKPVTEFEAHLQTCQRCCGELEFAKQVRESLRTPAAGVEVSPETHERVESFLRRLGERD